MGNGRTEGRRWLRRARVQGGLLAACLVASLALAETASTDLVIAPATDHEPPTQATRVDRLMREHDCWSGDGPDVIPTWAVVARPGRPARRVPAELGFRVWEGDAPGTLYGFCR